MATLTATMCAARFTISLFQFTHPRGGVCIFYAGPLYKLLQDFFRICSSYGLRVAGVAGTDSHMDSQWIVVAESNDYSNIFSTNIDDDTLFILDYPIRLHCIF